MITPELLDFIRRELTQGKHKDEIANSLVSNGWQYSDVQEGLRAIDPQVKNTPLATSLSATVPQVTASPRSKTHKLLIVIVAVIIGLTVIGGGVYAYSTFYYAPPPERVFTRMLTSLATVKTFGYQGEVRSQFPSLTGVGEVIPSDDTPATPAAELQELVTSFSGAYDLRDAAHQKNSFTISVSADSPLGKVALGLETRTIGDTGYIQLTDLTLPAALSFFDLSTIKKQWVRVDVESVKNLLTSFGVDPALLTELESQINTELGTQGKEFQALMQKVLAKVTASIKEKPPVKITKSLGSESIEGRRTYHYAYEADKEGLTALYLTLTSAFLEMDATSEIDPKTIEQELKEVVNTIDIRGEIWIGRKDFLPYQATLDMNFIEQGHTITSHMTYQLKDFNQAVVIEVPASAKPLDQFVSELMGSFGSMFTDFSGATSFELKTEESATFENLDTLNSGAELRDQERIEDINAINAALRELRAANQPITEGNLTSFTCGNTSGCRTLRDASVGFPNYHRNASINTIGIRLNPNGGEIISNVCAYLEGRAPLTLEKGIQIFQSTAADMAGKFAYCATDIP